MTKAYDDEDLEAAFDAGIERGKWEAEVDGSPAPPDFATWHQQEAATPGIFERWQAEQMTHLTGLLDPKTVLLDHKESGHSSTHDTAVLIGALGVSINLCQSLRQVFDSPQAEVVQARCQEALDLIRKRIRESHA